MLDKLRVIIFLIIMVTAPATMSALRYEIVDMEETRHLESGWVQPTSSFSSAPRAVIYQVVMNLRAGDVISATAQTELTNPYQKNYGVGRGIAISQDPNFPAEDWVNPPTFSYLVPAEHHGVLNMAGDYTILQDGLYTISLVVYSVIPGANELDYLKVEDGYGFLNVKVYRPGEE